MFDPFGNFATEGYLAMKTQTGVALFTATELAAIQEEMQARMQAALQG